MPTSEVPITPGSGLNGASFTFTEDGKTKHLQRTVPSRSNGAEILVSTEAGQELLRLLLVAIQAATESTASRLQTIIDDSEPAPTEFSVDALGPKLGAAALAVTTAKDDIKLTDVIMTPDTSALAAGDVAVDSQIVSACVKADDALGVLQSFTLACLADQGVACTVYLLSSSAAIGAENSAPSIADGNAANILGFFDIAASDYKDLGAFKIASIKNIGLTVKPVAGTDDIYIAIVNGASTPTFGASSLIARLGIVG